MCALSQNKAPLPNTDHGLSNITMNRTSTSIFKLRPQLRGTIFNCGWLKDKNSNLTKFKLWSSFASLRRRSTWKRFATWLLQPSWKFIEDLPDKEVWVDVYTATFQRADRELKSMFKRGCAFFTKATPALANEGVKWSFIP